MGNTVGMIMIIVIQGFKLLQDNVDVVNLADNDVSNNAEIGH